MKYIKKSIILFIILAILLSGCMPSEKFESNSTELPEQTTETADSSTASVPDVNFREETASAESGNPEISLLVFEKVFIPVASKSERTSLYGFTALLNQENLHWTADEGIVEIVEPDNNGSYLYAILTNEQGFDEIAQLGYHYKATGEEYTVMVDMTGSTPRYLVDVVLQDSGIEVTSLEAVISYIWDAASPSMDTGNYNDAS